MLVAHAAWVERGFLGALLRAHGARLRGPVIDTEALGRLWLAARGGEPPRALPLARLAAELGLPAHRPHTAAGDALTTAQAFLALATHLERLGGPETVRSLARAPERLDYAELMRADDVVEEIVGLGDRELAVLRPRDSEALLDEHAFEHEEFLPYWAELWPSGVALARAVAGRALHGARTLELGCGLGLPSIAAALAGGRCWRPTGRGGARVHARERRALGAAVETLECSWAAPAPLVARAPWDLVLAADVLYERATATAARRCSRSSWASAARCGSPIPAARRGGFLRGARRRTGRAARRRTPVIRR